MVCCLLGEGTPPPGALEGVARACSPRVTPYGPAAVVFDASGLARVIGPPPVIADAVVRLAAERGLRVRVALAGTAVAAWLLAQARPGVTVVAAGGDAAAVSGLPVDRLARLPWRDAALPPDWLAVVERWGVRTLGDLARLPRAAIRARLGPAGVRLHQAACGEDAGPLVPADEAVRFVERLALEWPIEGLEPLAFVLGRLCDALAASLERAGRGAIALTTRLDLVTRRAHERVLHLPAPMRDARVLRTLIVLDLESHPPDAGVDAVSVEAGVAPGRIVQGALFAAAVPAPEDLATLVARLGALAGEARVGAPALVDSHDPRQAGLAPFVLPASAGRPAAGGAGAPTGVAGLRRLRRPVPARVTLDRGRPVRVQPSARGLAGGAVIARAGPWRSSGRWWALDRSGWDREEWDVELAGGGCYRLARDGATGAWEVDAIID